MAFRDLREFIKLLDERGELVRVRAQVDPELESPKSPTACPKGRPNRTRRCCSKNVKGSALPVLINAFGSERRMAWALGVGNLDELNRKLAAVMDLRLPQGLGAALNRTGDLLGVIRSVGLGPTLVSHAPCQQIVHLDDDLSLSPLPILKCWPKDGGDTSRFRRSSRATRSPARATWGCTACRF